MRLFVAAFLVMFSLISSLDSNAASSEEKAGINSLPKSNSIDQSKLSNEKYNPGTRPWLVEKSSGDILAKDIYRAILIPKRKVLHVEYVEGRNQELEVLVENVTLMTTKGPCKITKDDIVCPQ